MDRRLRANISFLCLTLILAAAAWGAAPVMVEDFEKVSSPPAVWVVNIPNENAYVRLSTDRPHDGKQCLKLHYHFVSAGGFQYLGIPTKVRIQVPVHKLRFWLRGDDSKCAYGVQISDASGETHQFSKNTGQGGIIDFTGWREVVIDLDSRHETWGGDKNGKIDYPITAITLTIGQPMEGATLLPIESNLAFDSLSVDSEWSAVETLGCQVSVTSPEYCSEIKGNTTVTITAPGFKRVTVRCWKQGGALGSDSIVATPALDARGNGSFVFPADVYPHGPITLRISGETGLVKDNCCLQLYNHGGVSWNEGMPKDPPPPAKGWHWFSPTTSKDRSRSQAPIPKRPITITSRQAAGRTSAYTCFPGTTHQRTRFRRLTRIYGSGRVTRPTAQA